MGTSGIPGGARVSTKQARDLFTTLSNGEWDPKVYPLGPWLLGNLRIGYYSFIDPYRPDKRIKYWRE